jgi:hypothetical protein
MSILICPAGAKALPHDGFWADGPKGDQSIDEGTGGARERNGLSMVATNKLGGAIAYGTALADRSSSSAMATGAGRSPTSSRQQAFGAWQASCGWPSWPHGAASSAPRARACWMVVLADASTGAAKHKNTSARTASARPRSLVMCRNVDSGVLPGSGRF